MHGGVRYLEQGNVALVMSALKERGMLRQNAPHLVHDLAFVVPNYSWWEAPFYGIGLKLYDLLAGKYGFGASKVLSKDETLERLPALEPEELRGGVVYYDGQFDDARLLIHLALTAADHGGTLVNYCPATGLLRDHEGYVSGVTARDTETGEELLIPARIVVNATGVFTDSIRRMADPAVDPLVVTSQGIHLVFDRSFLKGDTALMVPRTSDGRVLFVIPWHGHAVAGTTDTPLDAPCLEPRPLDEEIEFILDTASRYLTRPPTRADVLSVYVGLRPLVKGEGKTSTLSRDHIIHVDPSGLLTITGGKWTTYRHMAEDCVDHCHYPGPAARRTVPDAESPHPWLSRRRRCPQRQGGRRIRSAVGVRQRRGGYSHACRRSLARRAARSESPLQWRGNRVGRACEMARTVEDALARRTRALFLNSSSAIAMAPAAAKLLAAELGRDQAWIGAGDRLGNSLSNTSCVHDDSSAMQRTSRHQPTTV